MKRAGQIVLFTFPQTGLAHGKSRPALLKEYGLNRLQRESLPLDGYIQRLGAADVPIRREHLTIIPLKSGEPEYAIPIIESR